MLFKRIQGGWVPDEQESADYTMKAKHGDTHDFKASKPRNVKFHRKYFALLDFAFEHWEPGELKGREIKNIKPEKNRDRFRADLTILTGHYKQVIRVGGELLIEPKSISFAKMNDEQFEELYSNTINAILKRILTNYDREQLDNVIMELLRFDG